MESSHANNVGCAKFINDCLYDTKTPVQKINPNYRNSICGFPILLYINDKLEGVYNFNLDRFSQFSYGYKEFKECLCYEVSANSDTTAGAFHKWNPDKSDKNEHDYYASDFEVVYPISRTIEDNFAEIKRVVEWVDDATDEMFKDQIENYFNLEYLMRYYLTVMVFGCVDNLGKNMKLTTFDGMIWYPQFYDLDTSLGLDNTGFLKYDMDIEVVPGVFNTSGSKLWSKLTKLFQKELEEQYAAMRLDRFTVDNIMKYLGGEQVLKIPEINYNLDTQRKYLDYGPSYLSACHGNRYQHMKRWIRERLVYVDTLMKYYGSTSEYVTIRANKLGKVFIDLQTYIPMYLRVKFRDEANDAGTITKRVARNEVVRFEYNIPTETDQEIIIYASRYLKSMGDVSNLAPTTMLVANANKLVELKCTNAPRLISTDVSECKLLQSLDLSGCGLLGTGTQNTLTVSDCRYLKKINLYGTSLTAVYTSLQGGNIEEIIYPSTIQSVSLSKQSRLKTLGLPYKTNEECTNLASFDLIDCPNVERLTIDRLPDGFNSFIALKHVQSLYIKNSLKLTSMVFDGFNKLMGVKLENMYHLETCGFDNMNNIDDIGTLRNITISNCPKIAELTMNVTGDNKAIIFSADNSIIDLTGATSIKRIVSNASIKGLKTLILPRFIEDIIFEKVYGDGISEISNLWSYSSYTDHKTDGYNGLDFKDLNVKNLDLTSCVYIEKGINFKAAPVETLVFDKEQRESLGLPAIKLIGSLDLTNFKGSYSNMFRNMDITELELQCSKAVLSQSNFTGMFRNSKFLSNKSNVLMLTQKMHNASTLDYMFAESDLDAPINITATGLFSAAYLYEQCRNFTSLDNIVVSDRCISADGMFMKCVNVLSADNFVMNATGSLSGTFKDCTSMKSMSISNPLGKGRLSNLYSTWNGCESLERLDVSKLDVSNVNTFYGTFDGCKKMINIDISTWDMSRANNISTMYQGCDNLVEIDFTGKDLRQVTTASYFAHFCPNLTKVKFSGVRYENITNMYCMFRLSGVKELIDFVIPSTVNNWAECFNGCPLENTTGLKLYADVISGTRGIFSGNESIVKISDITLGANIKSLNKAFLNCRNLIEDIDIPNHITDVVDAFRNCNSMEDIHANWSKSYPNGISAANCYYGCNNIKRIDGIESTIDNIPIEWGGGGVLSILTASDILLLPDLTGKEPGLLTMTPELKASLTGEQIAMITAKNWTIV